MSTEDYLKHQEEEFRRKVELEAEERKLEETLEYQRRIEEEAKQKHLAEQFKNAAGTSPYNFVEETGAFGSNLNVACLSQQDCLTYNNQPKLHGNNSPVCVKDIEFGDFHFSEVSSCKNYGNVDICQSEHESDRHDVLLNSEGHRFVGNEFQPSGRNVGKPNSLVGSKMNAIATTGARGISSTSSSVQKINKTTNQSHSRFKQGQESFT